MRLLCVERPDRTDRSYAEARDVSGRLADVLDDAGVRRGDRVAVQTDKSPKAISLFLATLQVGGLYRPLNTPIPGPRSTMSWATPRRDCSFCSALRNWSI